MPAADGDREIAPVPDRGRRHRADQDDRGTIPPAMAATTDRTSTPKCRVALPHAEHCAADREHERAGKIEDQQQFLNRALVDRLGQVHCADPPAVRIGFANADAQGAEGRGLGD